MPRARAAAALPQRRLPPLSGVLSFPAVCFSDYSAHLFVCFCYCCSHSLQQQQQQQQQLDATTCCDMSRHVCGQHVLAYMCAASKRLPNAGGAGVCQRLL
jgi:hypothetical protein